MSRRRILSRQRPVGLFGSLDLGLKAMAILGNLGRSERWSGRLAGLEARSSLRAAPAVALLDDACLAQAEPARQRDLAAATPMGLAVVAGANEDVQRVEARRRFRDDRLNPVAIGDGVT